METQPNNNPFKAFMRSYTARFLIIGFITVLLIVPLMQLHTLVDERKSRQEAVNDEMEHSWGGPVAYHGIVLEVPVTRLASYRGTNSPEDPVSQPRYLRTTAWIYPEKSTDDVRSEVVEKHKGIFETPVFEALFNTRAVFNLRQLEHDPAITEIHWDETRLGIITSADARIQHLSDIRFNGRSIPISDQELLNHQSLLISKSAPFTINPRAPKTTALATLRINGTQAIRYQSLAGTATMQLRSNWKDPALEGTSLPVGNSLKLHKKGFSGRWETFHIGTKSTLHTEYVNLHNKDFATVRFIHPVDHYQLNERTIKYALLVVALTFAVFFLMEVIGKMYVHPLHYFMIGLALLLFYSLLLSFSEQIGFIPAYLIAALAIVLLLFWYARSVLKSLRFALMSAISLSLLYTFLLVMVNLEIYALIVGSIGLLIALAGIMSVTRKIQLHVQ